MIRFDLHPATPAISVLSAPELALDEVEIEAQTGWNARQDSGKTWTVALASSQELDSLHGRTGYLNIPRLLPCQLTECLTEYFGCPTKSTRCGVDPNMLGRAGGQ